MSSEQFSIFEVSISMTQHSSIHVRASSEEEALAYIEQNPFVAEELVWDKPDYDSSLFEVFEDGESFDIDLEEEEEPSDGTLILTKAPLNALVVIEDAGGKRYELRVKDQILVTAGLCTWEVFVDGKAVNNGTYEVFGGEWNPLIIK